MPQKCHVFNCTAPVIALGLCGTHYMRQKRHGDVEAGRPEDWGKREAHPAYIPWTGIRRYHLNNMDPAWRDDFWTFVKDVGERPKETRVARVDRSKPWSKDNFYWQEARESAPDKKAYMREWHRKARRANKETYLDKYFQKKYGVTLEWHRQTLEDQGGNCAVCGKPEFVKILGELISLSVDHDHATGKARGLLCTKCNRGLGLFNDNVGLLKAASDYISKHSSTAAGNPCPINP